ncbi:MAG TPA: aminoacyl-tRNA hydrolase [Saprospiraceae bacterium]|nr:aminoacyl-tRNA hydrolase [Saprospiraceae bacterium]HMQ81608.1 aminoacyl-tRNA hydrolase [Saprospiraceae bacterium]
MKYLIVGLGNIGAEYENTRHNIGFKVLEAMAEAAGANWNAENLGSVAQIKHKGRILILLKPSTYMNLSGKAVRYWMQKEKVDKPNLLVVLDDLNLPFGKQRLRGKGSDGGHNGLKDIDRMCGGNDYARLRLGIGNDFPTGRQVNYVLGAWTAEEEQQLGEIMERASEAIKAFASIGIQHAMNQYNN